MRIPVSFTMEAIFENGLRGTDIKNKEIMTLIKNDLNAL